MQKTDNYIHGMDWTNKEVSLSNLSNYRKYQFNLIRKYIGKSILEIGSGDRGFTNEIVRNTLHFDNLLSIEPSETLFNMYENSYKFPSNVKFEQTDLFELKEQEKPQFDTIILIHVLEHIENDIMALNKLYDLISLNGNILIEVPALPFLFSKHDEMLGHYRRYNLRMFKSIIDQSKFEIVRLFYQDPIGILGSLIYFKLNRISLKSEKGTNLITKQGKLYDKFIIPTEGFIEKFITFPIGLSITAILKKV